LSRLPPSPPLSNAQRHNDYIYAAAHVHVDDADAALSDCRDWPVNVYAGFEVAPGDSSDIEVTNAHPWPCLWLVFSDGASASTASHPLSSSLQGITCMFSIYVCTVLPNVMIVSGKKLGTTPFQRNAEGRLNVVQTDYDVLLRKRA
jgi:hypothetical protein